jgi:hypothetical protein
MGEIDVLLLGVCGGFISALGALALTQFYWKKSIRNRANDGMYELSSVTVRRLNDEIANLRMKVVALETRVGDGE